MFESFSPVNSAKISPTEWLLARITDPTRAAAILGDLTEMAATRGRLWFWTAYARTVFTLGWRTPVAFICAIVSMRFLFNLVISLPMLWLMLHRHQAWIYSQIHPHIRGLNWVLCSLMVEALFFALPFVLIRFGLRDRLTQLTSVLLLITLPIYVLSSGPVLLDLFTVCSVLAIAVAILLPPWRRPLIILAATCIPVIVMNPFFPMWFLATVGVKSIPVAVFSWGLAFPVIYIIYKITAFTLAATACLYLYHRLLQQPPASERTIA